MNHHELIEKAIRTLRIRTPALKRNVEINLDKVTIGLKYF
ncbi:hypothetical protein CTH30272_00883 [Allocatenococcus thiocycli]|nr:hypothetical protein CTH30272_00883 [Catenococcus thiocycli]